MPCHYTQKSQHADLLVFPWQGQFYVGPAIRHYHTLSVIAKDTNRQQFSDIVKFRHSYLAQNYLTPEDRIIHSMSILTCTMTDAPAVTFITQLDAITDICNLFFQWRDTIDIPSPVPDPSVDPSTPPTLPPMRTHPLIYIPCVSLPTPMPSVAPTKAPHVQTYRATPRYPRLVPTPATTSQPTTCPPSPPPPPLVC